MKCANCSSEAVFTVTNPASKPVHYCQRCIPRHLMARANEGHFPLQAPLKSAPKKSKKKSEPEPEPVIEEDPISEPVEETPQEAPSEDL